jgi:hypothetical protein
MQFLILALHMATVLFMDDSCKYPKPLAAIVLLQYGIIFILFVEFYVKTYKKKAE